MGYGTASESRRLLPSVPGMADIVEQQCMLMQEQQMQNRIMRTPTSDALTVPEAGIMRSVTTESR